MKNRIHNQRGDAFILALVLMAVSGFVFLAAEGLMRSTTERIQLYKVRSQMNLLERKIRLALNQPQAYQGCQTSTNGSNGCTLNMTYLKSFEKIPLIGGCPSPAKAAGGKAAGATCGFEIKNLKLNTVNKQVTLQISFQGDFHLQAANIQVEIPDELLQSETFYCPLVDPTKPVFLGFEAHSGKLNCRDLPQCGSGSYMTGVNKNKGDVLCRPIPSQKVQCAGTQMLSSFKWEGNNVTHTCVDRLDPFAYFGEGS